MLKHWTKLLAFIGLLLPSVSFAAEAGSVKFWHKVGDGWDHFWSAQALMPTDPDGTGITVRSKATNGQVLESYAVMTGVFAPAVAIDETAKEVTKEDEQNKAVEGKSRVNREHG